MERLEKVIKAQKHLLRGLEEGYILFSGHGYSSQRSKPQDIIQVSQSPCLGNSSRGPSGGSAICSSFTGAFHSLSSLSLRLPA